MPEEKNYLDWNPILSPEQVYADMIGFSFLSASSDGTIYWVESRPSEKGRYTIVKLDNGKITEITPKTFNVRSQVHDYGGRPYTVGKNCIYFVNFLDQRIYKQNIKNLEDIKPLTPSNNKDESIGKYMDFMESADESRLFFVYEQEFKDHSQPKNSIAYIDVTKDDLQEPEILVKGNDFYTEFNLSSDGSHCCWLTWNLPYMPWDYTELWMADVNSEGFSHKKKVAGGNGESITSPLFGPKNNLLFVMDFPNKADDDFQNYWNIYRYDRKLDKIYPVTKEFVEFGQPLWISGRTNFRFITENELICLYRKNGRYRLAQLDLRELKLTKLNIPYTTINDFVVTNNSVYLNAGSSTLPKLITAFDYINGTLENEKIIIKSLPDQFILSDDQISKGRVIYFPTSDGEKGYGVLYLPKNPDYECKDKPPLIVLVHSGPTYCTEVIYSNYIQYWTSSGFTIFDIDHRGSTGYGRRFRDKLLKSWGEIEISDIKDAVLYLQSKNVISNQVAITGGSAGGYTVQRALTSLPDLFKVGASHFGVGNLETLAKLTHKFESRYFDMIIGEGEEILKERSPINHLDQLKAPMILFQGSEDRVVPPEVSREIAEVLRQKGIKTDYIEYPGESHGFRQLETKIDALNKESSFFRDVLKSDQ